MKLAGSRNNRITVSASLLLIAEIFCAPNIANAATAGSGVCQQTFTVTGTGEVAVFEGGGFCILAFKNTGLVNSQAVFTWTRPSLVTSADVLVVGGGGGGGSRHGGGGGAGGFVQADSFAISSASTIAIAVGAGGSASSSSSGTSGQNSYFKATTSATSGLIAIGGGAGSSGGGSSGGSGGGAGSGQTPGSVTTQTQSTFAGASISGINFGNSGAAGASDTNLPGDNNDYWAGGGGGGAAGVGTRPLSNGTPVTTFPDYSSNTARGGSGGAGKSLSWISQSVASSLSVGQTSSGVVYFAGGGGGGIGIDGQSGTGGIGGGANGTRTESSGNTGGAFTGGGGGGSGFDDINKTGSPETVSAPPGGAGGSGVVLVRFAIPDITAPSFTNLTSFSAFENSPSSTDAATITVNESSTITINSGNDSALFGLVVSDSTTARIRFLSSPNFESPTDVGTNNAYDISVRATDASGNFANQSIVITITNVNEAPSITNSSSSATASVSQAENIASVATYTATDPDAGAALRFTISGTDAADFSIDSVTGVIAFAMNPDFEAALDSDVNNTYIVIITVSDGALTDTQTVTVTITNANESSTVGAPTFSGSTIKGVSVTISITSNVAGKARFFVNGKRIPACLARSTSGSYPNFIVTCSWKPPVTGRQNVNATFTATDGSFSAATSPMSVIQVVKRGTTR
jgi:hypothetical protein